jgi:hypothetical protein
MKFKGQVVCCLVFVLTATSAAAAETDFTLGLGAQTQTSRVFVMDLGSVRDDDQRSLDTMIMTPSTSSELVGVFAIGEMVTAKWSRVAPTATDRALPQNVVEVHSGERAILHIDFRAHATSRSQPQFVLLHSASGRNAVIAFDYLIYPPDTETVVLTTQTNYLRSGEGEASCCGYHVASGPAPFGYAYDASSFRLASYGSHNRVCGGQSENFREKQHGEYSDCQALAFDSNNVEWWFNLEGHKDGTDKTHTFAAGVLTVSYRRRRTEPRLRDIPGAMHP